MPKNVKLAILRARTDRSPNPPISDQACFDMLMTGPNSVLSYWSDNTDGYLDFVGSAMLPWVDITINPADIDFQNGIVTRQMQVDKAYQAAKALNNNQDLTGYDGFVVITSPGASFQTTNPTTNPPAQVTIGYDAGAGAVAFNKPACALPVAGSDHTFMCHEVGHVLGFKHSFGVWNNGMDWDGAANGWIQGQEYGDPYDIMSSASFGTRQDPTLPTYSGTPNYLGQSPAGWPIQPQIGMGPAPARAAVHFWDSLAIPNTAVRHMDRPTSGVRTVRLYAAGRRNRSPCLIVVHPALEPPTGDNRCYLEYRESSGWDQGLDVAGADLARRAVVVHTLANTVNGTRVWYRGRILVPVEIDSDLWVGAIFMSVRVTGEDVDEGYVDLEISTSSARGIDLVSNGRDDIIDGRDLNEMGTPCGDTIIYGNWTMQSYYTFRAVTFGYGGEGGPAAAQPALTWTVGGTAVPDGSGTIDVNTAEGRFTVWYSIDPVTRELSLTSRGGEKYSAPVVVTATEPAGGNATTAQGLFAPMGYYSGFRPGDLGVLDRCMRKYMIWADLQPYELLIPPGPDPYRAQWRDQMNLPRVEDAIGRAAADHPGPALALTAIAAMRYAHLR